MKKRSDPRMEAVAGYYTVGLTYGQIAKAMKLETRSAVAGLVRDARQQGYIQERRRPERKEQCR